MPIINQIVKGSGGSAPAHYIEKTVDANGKLVNGSIMINLSGVTSIGDYVLYRAFNDSNITGNIDFGSVVSIAGQDACNSMFYGCVGITSVNMGNVQTITGSNSCSDMFRGCTGITSVDLSALKTVYSGCSSMFRGCTSIVGTLNLGSLETVGGGNNAMTNIFDGCVGITSVNLGKLKNVSSNSALFSAFENCTGITSVDIGELTNIPNGSNMLCYMFRNCSSLTSMSFYSLAKIGGNGALYQIFSGCTNLSYVSFNSLALTTYTGYMSSMLNGVTGCTVHFPSNMQSIMGSHSDVTNGFSGTNTTVLFDLPATNTLTGADTVEYTRNPKYDTATALAWKVGAYGTTNFDTPYYTSGLTDPAVSDTIYSDSACTTAVTTISSIA